MSLGPVTRKYIHFKLSEREALETYNKAAHKPVESYEELIALGKFTLYLEDSHLDSGLTNLYLTVMDNTRDCQGEIELHAGDLMQPGVFLTFR